MRRATRATAIVLAGRRDGTIDPLAADARVEDKCLVPVAGRRMLLHVAEALVASPEIGQVRLVINDPAVLDGIAALDMLRAREKLIFVTARPNLAESVLAAAQDAAFPLLITTADNVLLNPATITEFIAGTTGADAAVAFARRDAVLAVHPDGQRRFYRFVDDAYSNCNTYWLANRKALAAVETFRGGGQFAKHPRRIIAALGVLNLVRFRFGLGTLDSAFQRFSRRLKLRLTPVVLTDGATADRRRSCAQPRRCGDGFGGTQPAKAGGLG